MMHPTMFKEIALVHTREVEERAVEAERLAAAKEAAETDPAVGSARTGWFSTLRQMAGRPFSGRHTQTGVSRVPAANY